MVRIPFLLALARVRYEVERSTNGDEGLELSSVDNCVILERENGTEVASVRARVLSDGGLTMSATCCPCAYREAGRTNLHRLDIKGDCCFSVALIKRPLFLRLEVARAEVRGIRVGVWVPCTASIRMQ